MDPASGYSVIAQMTRFGPVIQIGDREEMDQDEKPKFANLKPGQSIETINLAEAMELFQLPKVIGEYDGQEVTVNTGRFGPYVKTGEMFVNLPRGKDPMTITIEEAQELIQAKRRTCPFWALQKSAHYQRKRKVWSFCKME